MIPKGMLNAIDKSYFDETLQHSAYKSKDTTKSWRDASYNKSGAIPMAAYRSAPNGTNITHRESCCTTRTWRASERTPEMRAGITRRDRDRGESQAEEAKRSTKRSLAEGPLTTAMTVRARSSASGPSMRAPSEPARLLFSPLFDCSLSRPRLTKGPSLSPCTASSDQHCISAPHGLPRSPRLLDCPQGTAPRSSSFPPCVSCFIPGIFFRTHQALPQLLRSPCGSGVHGCLLHSQMEAAYASA